MLMDLACLQQEVQYAYRVLSHLFVQEIIIIIVIGISPMQGFHGGPGTGQIDRL